MTNTTNESEAMEVWRKVFIAWNRPVSARAADQAAARVIATALEARDARIAELEGALGNAKAHLEYLDERFPTGSTPGVVGQIEAILTKGNNRG